MNKLYGIMFQDNITSNHLYNNILPQLQQYFKNDVNKEMEIVFDFTHVEYISPTVIPNILNIGFILKNYFSSPVRLFIPWKPKLLSYLHDINFLNLANRYDIFLMDSRYIGGYDFNKISPEYKTYMFLNDVDKAHIAYQIQDSVKVIKEICRSNDKMVADRSIEQILNIFIEICHNACYHSRKPCFATFQSNIGDKVKFKKAYISIADCGHGYNRSIIDKIKENEYNPLFLTKSTIEIGKKDENYLSILEAIFFRKQYENYGLFDVVKSVIYNNGTVRIHSNDTQLVITRSFYEKYLNDIENNSEKIQLIKDIFKEGNSEGKYNVKHYTNRYKGVHIEIEVPIEII